MAELPDITFKLEELPRGPFGMRRFRLRGPNGIAFGTYTHEHLYEHGFKIPPSTFTVEVNLTEDELREGAQRGAVGWDTRAFHKIAQACKTKVGELDG